MNYKILENVYLSSHGLIFDEDMNLMKLSRLHDDVYTDEFKYSSIQPLPDGDYVDLTHYYAFCPFPHRYDVFSRVRHVEDIITDSTQFLLGNVATEQRFSKNRFKEEAELFGIKNKLYHPDNNVLFHIKKLIYPEWLFGDAPCAFTDESFLYCRNKYQDYFQKSDERFKLFLTREHIARKITNSEFVHDFFRKHGFTIVYGNENLQTTVNYFYNADIIVGIHGGLFSNLLFCGDIKKIIEIFPSNRFNGCFTGWNTHLKTNYDTLTFPSDSDISNNISFDQKMLDEIIKKVEKTDEHI